MREREREESKLNQSPSSKMLEGIKGWGILNLISYASANHTASINKLAAYRERERSEIRKRGARSHSTHRSAATREKRETKLTLGSVRNTSCCWLCTLGCRSASCISRFFAPMCISPRAPSMPNMHATPFYMQPTERE